MINKKEIKNILITWTVILLGIILLGISRLFYQTDQQDITVPHYSFTGIQQEDGVHYTITDRDTNYTGSVGDELIIYNHTVTYRGKTYDYKFLNSYLMDSNQADVVTFQLDSSHIMTLMSNSYFISSGSINNIPQMTTTDYGVPLFAAALANRTFVETQNNPAVFQVELFCIALFALVLGTFYAFCPTLLYKFEQARLSRIKQMESDEEFIPTETYESLRFLSGFILLIIGAIMLIFSFYFNL